MVNRFEGRAAIVTGGAQGIGRAVAERLIAEGARVLLFDLERDAAEAAAREMGCDWIQGDVSRREDVRRAVEACLGRLGRLDALVANAGTADVKPFLDVDDAGWRRVLEVNLNGVFYCVQEAARVMARSRGGNGGAIVATASTNAFYVESGMAHYNVSKGGVVALVRSAALDLAAEGVRVNAVAPGVVKTRLSKFLVEDEAAGGAYRARIPIGRFAKPADIAGGVAFLASDDAAYVTGHTLVADGGLTLGIDLGVEEATLPGFAREGES